MKDTKDTGVSLIEEAQGIRKRANTAIKALFNEAGIKSIDILAEVDEDDREEIGVIDVSQAQDGHVTVEGVEVKACDLVILTLRDSIVGEQYDGTVANLSADDCALLLRELEDDIAAIKSGERPHRAL